MFVLLSRFASFRPRVRRHGKQLSVATPLWMQLAMLGGYRRQVHIDGDARYVFVNERQFWFWGTSRVVRFRQIERISYGFRETPTSFNILGKVLDTVERFDVSLKLEGERAPLLVARFWGEGVAGDIGTLVFGDDLLDVEGTQADDSRAFVRHLTEITGIDLVPTFSQVSTEGDLRFCAQCSRRVPARVTCLYCGGELSVTLGD